MKRTPAYSPAMYANRYSCNGVTPPVVCIENVVYQLKKERRR